MVPKHTIRKYLLLFRNWFKLGMFYISDDFSRKVFIRSWSLFHQYFLHLTSFLLGIAFRLSACLFYALLLTDYDFCSRLACIMFLCLIIGQCDMLVWVWSLFIARMFCTFIKKKMSLFSLSLSLSLSLFLLFYLITCYCDHQ